MEEQEYNDQDSMPETGSIGIDEAMHHLKATVHDLRLKDACSRQKIRKLERDNHNLKTQIQELDTDIKSIEKQKGTDEQYLLKQQEIIVNLEIADAIKGEKVSQVDTLKDRVKLLKASNKRINQFEKDLRDATYNYDTNCSKILELQEIGEQVEDVDDEDKPSLVNELLVKIIDVLEKSVKAKEDQIECFKDGMERENNILSKQKAEIDQRYDQIKQLRVSTQKQIFELEKRLAYVEEGQGQDPDIGDSYSSLSAAQDSPIQGNLWL